MAQLPELTLREDLDVVFRAADPEFSQLRDLVFRRYPADEWASFIRCGWRATPTGLVLTLASVDGPEGEDMDDAVGHVLIREPYSRRIALAAPGHGQARGQPSAVEAVRIDQPDVAASEHGGWTHPSPCARKASRLLGNRSPSSSSVSL